jgi:hypothetical protein
MICGRLSTSSRRFFGAPQQHVHAIARREKIAAEAQIALTGPSRNCQPPVMGGVAVAVLSCFPAAGR